MPFKSLVSRRPGRLIPFFPQAGASPPASHYAEVLRDTYGASEIWPLVDIASGTTIPAFINSNRNGTLSGWALQNRAGPVSGGSSPTSDGVNDRGNIYSSNGSDGLVDIFNGDVGSAFIWYYLDSSWAGTDVVLVMRDTAGNNRIWFEAVKGTALVGFGRTAGGTTKQQTISSAGVVDGWHSGGLSWDTGADEVIGYSDGAAIGAALTSIGTFVGSLSSQGCAVGEYRGDATLLPWLGSLAYAAVKFGSIWTPADFAGMHAAAATSLPD